MCFISFVAGWEWEEPDRRLGYRLGVEMEYMVNLFRLLAVTFYVWVMHMRTISACMIIGQSYVPLNSLVQHLIGNFQLR